MDYLIAGKLPRRQLALAAALLLLGGAVLVNIAPQNPYMVGSIKIWQLHHFLSFNGTTRIVSSVWPFAAALYLAWLWGRYTGFAGRLAGPR